MLTVQVSAGNKIYRGRKRSSTDECTGNVFVDMLEDKNPKDNNLDPRSSSATARDTREVPSAELALWKGSMINLLGNIAIPEPDIIKPPIAVSNGGSADPGVYWEKADLHIILHVGQNAPAGGHRRRRQRALPPVPHRGDHKNRRGRHAALYKFMSDRGVERRTTASITGTMPIFITDVPVRQRLHTDAIRATTRAQSNAYNPQHARPRRPANFPHPQRRLASHSGAYTEANGHATTSPSISITAAAASTTGAKRSGCCCSTSTCAT